MFEGTITRFLELDAAARLRLRDAFLKMENYVEFENMEAFVASSERALQRSLSDSMLDAIEELRRPSPFSALVIDGFPVDDLPPTPDDGVGNNGKKTSFSEAALLAVARRLGEPVSYGEKPALVHQVVPLQGLQSSLTNAGSRAELGFHIEHAAFDEPRRDTHVLLFGLRSDHEGKARLRVADGRAADRACSAQSRATLRRLEWDFGVPYFLRKRLPESAWRTGPRAAAYGFDKSPVIRFVAYGDILRPITSEANEAHDEMAKQLNALAVDIETVPGRMVIVPNRTTLHARTTFEPRFDGQDRWAQRVSVADSLYPLAIWQDLSPRHCFPTSLKGDL